jgi:hypothetical protein
MAEFRDRIDGVDRFEERLERPEKRLERLSQGGGRSEALKDLTKPRTIAK